MKRNTLKKNNYRAPSIEQIQLDNEISLVLASTELPPTYEQNSIQTPDFFNQQPYKMYQT